MTRHGVPEAVLAGPRRGANRVPAPARGGHQPRHRRREREGRQARRRVGPLRPGLSPVRLGRPGRVGPDRSRRHVPRPTDAERREPDDRVPAHDHGRLDSADDRRRAEASALLPRRRRAGRPLLLRVPLRRAGVGDPLRRREAGRQDVPEEAERAVSVVRQGQETGRVPRRTRGPGPRRKPDVDPGVHGATSLRRSPPEAVQAEGRPDAPSACLIRRREADVEARWPQRNRQGAAAPGSRPGQARPLHAHSEGERTPGPGNRRRPLQPPLTCPP